MVRNLVGTLIEIGRGAMNLDELKEVIETGDWQSVDPPLPHRVCIW